MEMMTIAKAGIMAIMARDMEMMAMAKAGIMEMMATATAETMAMAKDTRMVKNMVIMVPQSGTLDEIEAPPTPIPMADTVVIILRPGITGIDTPLIHGRIQLATLVDVSVSTPVISTIMPLSDVVFQMKNNIQQ